MYRRSLAAVTGFVAVLAAGLRAKHAGLHCARALKAFHCILGESICYCAELSASTGAHSNVNVDERVNQTNRFRDTAFKGTRSSTRWSFIAPLEGASCLRGCLLLALLLQQPATSSLLFRAQARTAVESLHTVSSTLTKMTDQSQPFASISQAPACFPVRNIRDSLRREFRASPVSATQAPALRRLLLRLTHLRLLPSSKREQKVGSARVSFPHAPELVRPTICIEC